MLKMTVATIAALAASTLTASVHAALIYATPSRPTDETAPRIVNDAPVGFGSDAWQGAAAGGTGKVNAYFTPQELFGHSITVGDIQSITYYIKRAPTTPAANYWFLNLYTDKLTGDPKFYHQRFSDGGGDLSTTDGTWQNRTVTDVFEQVDGGSQYDNTTLTAIADSSSTVSTQGVQFFSVQTSRDSASFDGLIDGLVVTLKNNEVGTVDFSAVPEPTTLALFGLGAIGLLARRRRTVVA